MSTLQSYCGYVAIVGRPNVGKSTLLNQLLGKKVSITSHKAQTTRYQIIGIETKNNYQIIYVDTPGLHIAENRALNRVMNRVASSSIGNVELIIFVVEGTHWKIDDEMVVNKLRFLFCPVLLVINKIDNVVNKERLLPHITFLSNQMNFLDVVLISAKKGIDIDLISKIVRKHMPIAPHYFPADCITNRSQRFMVAEIIREKLMRFLGDELPYAVTVKIANFMINKQLNSHNIHGLILVERSSQKKIVIGSKGSKIKKIGIEAQMDIEKLVATKIHLKLWVKVKNGWTDDERALRNLGYMDDLH
ncbi:MAG: GTPase Era [Candidatus Arsenophonus melophagi]|nr:GTPase Era [Candidatus Arsenophonus melophagi]